MKNQKTKNEKAKRKIGVKLKAALLMLLVAVFSISGIICVNAATIKDDGKYSLVLQCNAMSEGTIDGETSKIVKFDVADGEDSVSIAELTKGIVPFDGEHEFSHWSTDFSGTSKADDEIPISKFTSSGNVYPSVAATAITVFPFTVTETSLPKVYPFFGNSIIPYTYFFPLSNAVMVGKVLYAPPSEYHAATGTSFSFNSCQYSFVILY